MAVLDDAFQHRAIGRQVDIVLVAAEHGTRRALLPRGRLRETFRSLARAQAVVVTRKTASRAEADRIGGYIEAAVPVVLAQISFEAAAWTDLDGSVVSPPVGEGLVAVTSVAEPERFQEMVRDQMSSAVESFAFRDHHVFRQADVRRIVKEAGGRSIVTTEKDAVKLKDFSEMLPSTYVLRLRMVWESGHDDLMALIEDALEGA